MKKFVDSFTLGRILAGLVMGGFTRALIVLTAVLGPDWGGGPCPSYGEIDCTGSGDRDHADRRSFTVGPHHLGQIVSNERRYEPDACRGQRRRWPTAVAGGPDLRARSRSGDAMVDQRRDLDHSRLLRDSFDYSCGLIRVELLVAAFTAWPPSSSALSLAVSASAESTT